MIKPLAFACNAEGGDVTPPDPLTVAEKLNEIIEAVNALSGSGVRPYGSPHPRMERGDIGPNHPDWRPASEYRGVLLPPTE